MGTVRNFAVRSCHRHALTALATALLAGGCASGRPVAVETPAADAADAGWERLDGSAITVLDEPLAAEQDADQPAEAVAAEADEADEADEPDAPAAPADGELALHGSLSTRFIGQEAGGDHDLDLYAILALEVGDAEKDPYSGYLMGRLSQDLDGDTSGEDSPFASLNDTYDHSLNGRLYEAWVDMNDAGVDLLRIGRQTLYETPAYVRLDGVAVESEAWGRSRQQWGGYVGRPVHEHESSPEGDEAYGVFWKSRLWQGGRGRIDFMHLEDDQTLGTEQNDLWSGQLQQSVGTELNLYGDYTLLEQKPRDYDLRATWVRPEDGWLVQVARYELMTPQSVLVEELDPFVESLLEYFPFSMSRALASKAVSKALDIEGGIDVRRVDDDDDIGEFNRDFERWHLTSTVHDVGVPDLDVALTGELWDGDGSGYDTWGLDVTREWTKQYRASIGSYYALFKNDFLLDEEREDVRTYYATLRLLADPRLTWMFGYEFEDNDIDHFHTLTAKAAWRF